MEKIEELKTLINDLFDKSESQEEVNNLAKINACLEVVEAEHKKAEDQLKEVLKDYKELVKHTSFSLKDGPDLGISKEVNKAPELNDFIDAVIKKRK